MSTVCQAGIANKNLLTFSGLILVSKTVLKILSPLFLYTALLKFFILKDPNDSLPIKCHQKLLSQLPILVPKQNSKNTLLFKLNTALLVDL